MAQIAGWLAFTIAIIGYIWISVDVYKGKTTLALSTWIIWSGVNFLIYGAMLSQDVFSWQMTAYVVGTCFVTVLAYLNSTWAWSKLDVVVILMATAAMVLWYFANANVSIAMSLTAETIGSIPMWVAIWKDPKSQSVTPWLFFGTTAMVGLFAIEEWDYANAMMPIWMFIMNMLTVSLIARGWISGKLNLAQKN